MAIAVINFASFNQAGFLKHHEKFEDIFFKNQFSKSPFGVDGTGALQQRRGRGGGSQGAHKKQQETGRC